MLFRECICCEADSPLNLRTLSMHRRYRGISHHTGHIFPHFFCDVSGVVLEFYIQGKLCEPVGWCGHSAELPSWQRCEVGQSQIHILS